MNCSSIFFLRIRLRHSCSVCKPTSPRKSHRYLRNNKVGNRNPCSGDLPLEPRKYVSEEVNNSGEKDQLYTKTPDKMPNTYEDPVADDLTVCRF